MPADLTERVLHVIGNQRGSDRCIIFISHRLIEIAAVCDRATVLREGATVGVVDINEGSEERIVALMLGERASEPEGRQMTASARQAPRPRRRHRGSPSASCAVGGRLKDVSFELRAGEVLGVAALEGQGQDELFDVLAGVAPTRRRASSWSTARPVSFRHPADAIRAGVVYVPADRAEALLMQRSVRENVALPYIAGVRSWGPIGDGGRGEPKVNARDRSGSRSTPAPRPRSASCPAATSRR